MRRHGDLADWLRAAEARPFRYGRWDCVRFTAGWVERATGTDPLAGNTYDSLAGGRALLAANGWVDLRAAVTATLPEIPRLWAVPGDLAMIDGGLGIVTGAEVACLRRGGGLLYLPLDTAEAVWRVA